MNAACAWRWTRPRLECGSGDFQTNANLWSDEVFHLYGLARAGCQPGFASWVWRASIPRTGKHHRGRSRRHRSGAVLNIEWRAVVGSGRWLLSRGQPIFGANGAGPQQYLGIVMDITEKKAVEAELKDIAAYLEHLVEARTSELAEANRAREARGGDQRTLQQSPLRLSLAGARRYRAFGQ